MIHDTPTVAAGLVALLTVLVVLQRRIGWRSDWPSALRRTTFPALDRVVGRWRPLVRDKTDHDEFVVVADCPSRELRKALHDYGYRPNLLSTLKYVTTADGTAFEDTTWVYRETLRSKWMYHVYAFETGDGGMNVHQHREINYLHDPRGHTHGPRERRSDFLPAVLDAAGISDDWGDPRPYATA